MTSNGPGGGASSSATMASPSINTGRQDGPYVLQPWVDSVPLSADNSQDDVKINCVEYFGPFALCSQLCRLYYVLMLAQTAIFMLGLLPLSFFISSASLQIPPTSPGARFLSQLPGSHLHSPRTPLRGLVSSKSCYCLEWARRAYYATERSLSTLFRS